MKKNTENDKRICIVFPKVDKLLLKRFYRRQNYNTLVIETNSSLTIESFSDTEVVFFNWKEYNPIKQLKIQSVAFDILSEKDKEINIKPLKKILGIEDDDKIIIGLISRILVESYSEVLKTLALANIYLNQSNDVSVTLPESYRNILNSVLIYLKSSRNHKKSEWDGIENISFNFIGSPLVSFLKDYLKSIGTGLYFLLHCRRISRNKRKKYKVGLLAWKSSKMVDISFKDNEGLDSILPRDLPSREVLVYGKDGISNENLQAISQKGFNSISLESKNVYKFLAFDDLKFLLMGTLRLLIFLPFSLNLSKQIRKRLPYILYHYYKWTKFIKTHSIRISIGYLEYSLGDLIRNNLLMKAGTSCLSYNHSMSDCQTIDKGIEILDTWKSFVPFSKRFYILPFQLELYKNSMIICNKNYLTGPLFTNNKSLYVFPKEISKNVFITVFTSSFNDDSLNQKKSHRKFFESIFRLLETINKDVTFLISLKYSPELITTSFGINSEQINEYVSNKRIIFLQKSENITEAIRSSVGVISMPFATPTVEAIALNIPGIYYDPIKLFPNNIFNHINGFYLDNYSSLSNYLDRLVKRDPSFTFWMQYIREELGISQGKNINGVELIHREILNLLV